MGVRLTGDPEWGYRLSREALTAVLALERADALDAQQRQREAHQRGRCGGRGVCPLCPAGAPGRGPRALTGAEVRALPQVTVTSPDAARFWGLG